MPRVLLLLLVLQSGYTVAGDYAARMESLKLVGEAEYSYMFWRAYDIALFDDSDHFDGEKPPYALRLKYMRDFSGASIADQSSKLIRKQGMDDEIRLAGWHAQMDQIFPDVESGDTLSGLYSENKETIFFYNGEAIGRIQDPLFGQYFFGIWLGENTTEPKLRKQLIGTPGD